MAGTRQPFFYRIFAGTVSIIQAWRQEIVAEVVEIEAGAVLVIEAAGRLVVLP